MTEMVRIGNAQAFWGDRSDAAAELLSREPDLDYLTLDYLAEVSMSILAGQRERDPSAGYARDFVDVVTSLAPYWHAGGRCRLISNAGGLNPAGCAEACREALRENGCRGLKIAVVTGDDVLPLLQQSTDETGERFRNLDSGESLTAVRDRLVTASVYLGTAPIVQALELGADIVITGRVADPSMVLAPCRHHYHWADDDWDLLAGGTVAGHLIECGTQVTGGTSTGWLDVPDPAHIGFPIVEVSPDGSCVVTKPVGTGGAVTSMTVREQLVYEIGDPGSYLSPDVAVSFMGLSVEEQAPNRVQVRGARGRPPPATFKVSATFRDGYRAAGTLTIYGRNAVAKGRRCGEIVLQRLREAGCEFRDSLVECLATGDSVAGLGSDLNESQLMETVLRVAVESEAPEAVRRFTRELMPLITSGPPGTTGYSEGRPRVQPVIRYWPCLIERDRVTPGVDLIEVPVQPLVASEVPRRVRPPACSPSLQSSESADRPIADLIVRDLAHARSGDKGIRANIGVVARRAEDYRRLVHYLTAERVAAYFRPLGVDAVERYEIPELEAMNFVLHGILRRQLRSDAQGKALAEALLQMKVPG